MRLADETGEGERWLADLGGGANQMQQEEGEESDGDLDAHDLN